MFEGLMQPMHLLVILFIALLFFGPSKLGDLGKGLGDGIRHFKNAMREGSEPATPDGPGPMRRKIARPNRSNLESRNGKALAQSRRWPSPFKRSQFGTGCNQFCYFFPGAGVTSATGRSQCASSISKRRCSSRL